jgi:hypothetical protein
MRHESRACWPVNSHLVKQQKSHEKPDEKQKKPFDKEKFSDIYSGTRIFFEDASVRVGSVLVGIDIEIDETAPPTGCAAANPSTSWWPITLIVGRWSIFIRSRDFGRHPQ